MKNVEICKDVSKGKVSKKFHIPGVKYCNDSWKIQVFFHGKTSYRNILVCSYKRIQKIIKPVISAYINELTLTVNPNVSYLRVTANFA